MKKRKVNHRRNKHSLKRVTEEYNEEFQSLMDSISAELREEEQQEGSEYAQNFYI